MGDSHGASFATLGKDASACLQVRMAILAEGRGCFDLLYKALHHLFVTEVCELGVSVLFVVIDPLVEKLLFYLEGSLLLIVLVSYRVENLHLGSLHGGSRGVRCPYGAD